MISSIFKSLCHTIKTRGLRITILATSRLAALFCGQFAFGNDHVVRRIYDYQLYLDAKDPGISRTLILFRQRELDHKWIMENCLGSGDSVLDIGANIGYYVAMEAHLIGRQGKIYAYEPSITNFQLLLKNLKLNKITGQVEAENAAISDKTGVQRFFLSQMSNLNTFHRSSSQEYIETDVNTLSINDVLEAHPDIRFIRMDVEGHEVEILRAAIPLLSNPQSDIGIIFELHINRYVSTDFLETLKKLWAVNYRCRYLSSSNYRGSSYFLAQGYRALTTMQTDEHKRSIFEEVRLDDLEYVISGNGGARTLFLQKLST